MLLHNLALEMALENTKKASKHFDYDRYFRFKDPNLDRDVNFINGPPPKQPRMSGEDVGLQVFKSNARHNILYPTNSRQRSELGDYAKLMDPALESKLKILHEYFKE